MDTEIKRSVIVDGREICYQLEWKNVKNLNLRVRKDGSVFVSASTVVPCKEIDEFVCSKAPFILRTIDHFHEINQCKSQPKQYVSGESFYIQGRGLRLQVSQAKRDNIFSDGIYIFLEVKDTNDFEKKRRLVSRYIDMQCKTIFTEILYEVYPIFEKYGITIPALHIKDMETRWGSCLPKKGVITLNKRLIEAPRNCIEYVVMHEMCHFLHPNHSKHFYAFLSVLMPDWKDRKQFLDKTVNYWL